ncbi:MAG: hypothetical protein IKK42_08045 [Oscillospiraceae bacterium]|nr:hypothetical protein [Oscillospiraceae bacterium]
MKKILITLMTVLALTAFSACESKEVGTAEETTASVAEETTAATESETTTEAETTTEKETEAETEPEVVEDTEVFVGTGYTLLIDGEKWLDGEEYKALIAKIAENTKVAQYADLSAEEIQDMSDALFFHADNSSNFNVTVSELGNIGELDDDMLKQLADIMVEYYNSMEGYTFEGYDIVEVNGYKAIKFVIMADNSGSTLKMNSYIFYKGTKQFVITYTVDASEFDETVAEFEKVLNTITLTDNTASDGNTDDSEADDSTEAVSQTVSYSVNGFSFDYNSSNWKQNEDDEEIFNYIASDDILKQATNFNIKQQDMGMDIDMNDEMMELFATSVKEEYNNTDGVTFLDWSAYTKSDNDVLLINCEAEYMGIKMKLQQYCFLKSGKMTILTFTAYSNCYDEMLPEFEAIVNSAELE